MQRKVRKPNATTHGAIVELRSRKKLKSFRRAADRIRAAGV